MRQNKELTGLAGSWAERARTARTQQHRHEWGALRGTAIGVGAIVLALVGPVHWLLALPVALAVFAWNTRGWEKAAQAKREADGFQEIAEGLSRLAADGQAWFPVEPERQRISRN